MLRKIQILAPLLLILGACTSTKITPPPTKEIDQLNSLALPDFPIPGKAVIGTLQGLKKQKAKEAEVFYAYFGKLMIFEKQYQVLKYYFSSGLDNVNFAK